MLGKALGLIETKGLIGAIEATDAAAKAASVVVSSVELTDATYLTLKIEGDLGAVQAAVEAGAAAAEKIGELIAVHVIPNPSEGLAAIIPNRRYVSKYHPEDQRLPLTEDDAEIDLPVRRTQSRPKVKPTPTVKPKATPKPKATELDSLTVSELRQIARGIENFPLKGREISMANKQQLIEEIKKFREME